MIRNILGVLLLLGFCMGIGAIEPLTQMAKISPQPLPEALNYKIETINLSGKIDKENVLFHLSFVVKVKEPVSFEIVSGELCEVSSEVTRKSGSWLFSGKKPELLFRNNGYWLNCPSRGDYELSFDFSVKSAEADKLRICQFNLLPALSRMVRMEFDTKDVELEIPGALNLKKDDNTKLKDAAFDAVLQPEGRFLASWKRHIDKIETSLETSVEATSIAEALPGTVRLHCLFKYAVIQGKLSEMKFAMSPDLNILSVSGQNVQDWRIEKENELSILVVKLSREAETQYTLGVEAEKVLPDFPCRFSMPSINPKGVLRLDGALAFGSNRAVKLLIEETSGLAQVDNASFPLTKGLNAQLPTRSLFTYRFSGDKYTLTVKADNVSPSCSLELWYTLNFRDDDLQVKALCSLEIKDAPLRDLLVKYDPSLTVSRIEGPGVLPNDYELINKDGGKWLKVHLKPETIGKTSISLNFEKNMKEKSGTVLPTIFIDGMKSVRGSLMLASAKGLSLQAAELKNLKEVHTGSAPIHEPGLKFAYRFKDQEWSGSVAIKREKTALASEVFHLLSIGEGTIYGSAMFSYHISGAPLDKFRFGVHSSIKNLEFTGRDIVDWKKIKEAGEDGMEQWELNLCEKIMGDFSILATYEMTLSSGENICRMGGIYTENAEAESGFIAVSSLRNLKFTDKNLPANVQAIDNSELPVEYREMIPNAVQRSYRCIRPPAWAEIAISSYPAEKLLDIAVDMSEASTRIDRNGQAETTIQYRVKNSSQQYLGLKLPPGANLWSVSVDNERKRLSSDEGKLLIPIPRHQDINTPIAISLTYAQEFGVLGARKNLPLLGPSLDVESIMSKWSVSVPDNYAFMNYDGNMVPLREVQHSGLSGYIAKTCAWLKNGLAAGLLWPWLLATGAGVFLAWSWARKKLRILASCLGLLGFALAFFIAARVLDASAIFPALRPFQSNTIIMTRLFCLPEEALSMTLALNDLKGFSLLQAGSAVLALALALVSFVASMLASSSLKRCLWAGFGTALLLTAGAQWLYVGSIAAFATALVLPPLGSILLWTLFYKKFRRNLANASAAASALLLLIPWEAQAQAQPLKIENVEFKIIAKDNEISAEAHYVIKAESPAKMVLLTPPVVLVGGIPKDNSSLELIRQGERYVLDVKSRGTYELDLKLLLPFRKENGGLVFKLPVPVCRRNQVSIGTDKENTEISSLNAVSFSCDTSGKTPSAKASFAPGSIASFELRPQLRKIEDEKTQFFATVNAVAKFMSGVVEIRNVADLQIAQGEASKFLVELPEGMRATAVEAPDLGVWRFNAEKRLLEILLTQPHSGALRILITSQIPNCNLPYQATIASLRFTEAARQHGAIGVCAGPAVQVQVAKNNGFNEINPGDFAPGLGDAETTLKKAFRCFTTSATLQVEASAVKPELRVTENCEVSFEEERTTLVSELQVEVAKAGIFSLAISVPESFEIDKLICPDMQGWDELIENKDHKVVINFSQRVSSKTTVHIELSRMGRLKGREFEIPRLRVEGADRHSGDLAISVERGTRMDTLKKEGIEQKTGLARKSYENTVQLFSLLRPDWSLRVSFNVAAPWIQVESLQTAKISEAFVECEALFHYSVENAGVKRFRVQLPPGAESPEFTGREIASSSSAGENLWEIELLQKAGREFKLKVQYRLPCSENTIKLSPAVAQGAELQTGYLAIFVEDSRQLKVSGTSGEISPFDPRKIPQEFNAGLPLPNAVRCFRTVGADYSVSLESIRHKQAETLRAEINKVELSSVVSASGMVVSTAVIRISNGNENYLRMTLPEGNSLWSAFNDGQPVEAAREGGAMLVPLKQSLGGRRAQTLELVYSMRADKNWKSSWQKYVGPAFDLPLKNVSWRLHMPQERSYGSFGGNMDYVNEALGIFSAVDSIAEYDSRNKEIINQNISKAKGLLSTANSFAAQGKRSEASEAYQTALNFSGNDIALNNDIQGQWQQMQREQSVTALANRRNYNSKKVQQAAQQRNAQADEMPNQNVPAASQSVESLKQQLGNTELKTLQSICDKIFDQQRAAASVPHTLSISVPKEGKSLSFERALQVKRDDPLSVEFKAAKSFSWRGILPSILALFATTLGFSIAYALIGTAMRRESARNS